MMTRSRGDHTELRPHLSQELLLQSPLAAISSPALGGKRSARGRGVPTQGKALLNPLYTQSSQSHPTCPPDLPIKTQEQIS